MLKRVDVATYDTFKAAKDGTFKGGIEVFGVKEGGVGYRRGRVEQGGPHARREEGGGRRQGRHHLRQDQGAQTIIDDNKCPV